ncbi:hypothetical protein FKW77_005453 [Venturia effusa]|uniref:Uncharacterized protein n=1 Tax=Venturia effusa TaxID=50376 RepID=A0A517L5F9_9PEZI|nr:hypothetical protein FKW77_005453 [Venturia effusa]
MPPVVPQYFESPLTPATSKSKPKHPSIPSPPRKPLLRLEIRDLSAKGSLAFLSLPQCGSILHNAVDAVLAWLYTSSSKIPPTRSITLILRDMPGVAYTTGSDIDSDHKEIHFSTSYIEGQMHKDGFEKEVLGVITHEMVHCWQWNAQGSCPGGLIEGIADFVRLRAGFVPGHWKKEVGGEWDAGYQHTGYFLDYLERKFGDGTVVKINETLRDRVYKERVFWEECCGCGVEELWKEYEKHLKKHLKKDKDKDKEEDGQGSEESFEIVEALETTEGGSSPRNDRMIETMKDGLGGLGGRTSPFGSQPTRRPQAERDNSDEEEQEVDEEEEEHDYDNGYDEHHDKEDDEDLGPEVVEQLRMLDEKLQETRDAFAERRRQTGRLVESNAEKDYLMQITLLTQQDKKRVLFQARQKRAEMHASGHDFHKGHDGKGTMEHSMKQLEFDGDISMQGQVEAQIHGIEGQARELRNPQAQVELEIEKQRERREEDMADATNPFL